MDKARPRAGQFPGAQAQNAVHQMVADKGARRIGDPGGDACSADGVGHGLNGQRGEISSRFSRENRGVRRLIARVVGDAGVVHIDRHPLGGNGVPPRRLSQTEDIIGPQRSCRLRHRFDGAVKHRGHRQTGDLDPADARGQQGRRLGGGVDGFAAKGVKGREQQLFRARRRGAFFGRGRRGLEEKGVVEGHARVFRVKTQHLPPILCGGGKGKKGGPGAYVGLHGGEKPPADPLRAVFRQNVKLVDLEAFAARRDAGDAPLLPVKAAEQIAHDHPVVPRRPQRLPQVVPAVFHHAEAAVFLHPQGGERYKARRRFVRQGLPADLDHAKDPFSAADAAFTV